MNRFLTGVNLFDRLLLNADGGGSAPPASGDNSAAAVPPAAAAAPPPPSAGDPPAGDPPPPAGDIYKPEGIADHLLGKNNNETIDNLKKAVDGYRERDAANKVPDTADVYGRFEGDIPDAIKPHLETLSSDPLTARMQDFALKNRIPLPHYQGLVKEFVSVSSEMGLMEPVVNAEEERKALVPDVARHLPDAEQKQAVEKRMNENYAFLDMIAGKPPEQGGLAKDDVEFAKAMLGDSAKGHRFIEWMKTAVGGGQGGNGPAMGIGGAGGTDPKADISRRAALPENTWGNPEFKQQSYDQLVADRKRIYGE